jgi:porphobilinogen deaminase
MISIILYIYIFEQEGGCSAPVAAHGEIQNGSLTIQAGVWSLDGSETRTERRVVKV